MKKKLVFIGMALLALVLTTGTFAYTYTNFSTATLDATIADAVWTTYQPSANQPNWSSILPEGEYGSEFLRPNAAGADTKIDYQYPGSGEHWDKVDEDTPDDWDTYVYTALNSGFDYDYYNLQNDPVGIGTISGITVYFRFASDPGATAEARAIIQTGDGSTFHGDIEAQTGDTFSTRSYTWVVNPETDEPWTHEEIDLLQAGIGLKSGANKKNAYCTQLYVQVNYEFVVTQGEVPLGELFDITPHEEYSGDLLVKLYLTNTADLLKAYQYINMKVYMADTLEAGETPDYQVLSIETGVILFNIEGGTAEDYTIEITGGSYRLLSDDSSQWGQGWSITPEFYCEVGQR